MVIKPLLKSVIAKETSLSMTSATAQRVLALDLLKSRGMLRLKDFMAEGIGPETRARLVRKAAVVRPARGLYQLPDTQIEAAHMLAEAAVLVPKGGRLPDLGAAIPRSDAADAVSRMDGD